MLVVVVYVELQDPVRFLLSWPDTYGAAAVPRPSEAVVRLVPNRQTHTYKKHAHSQPHKSVQVENSAFTSSHINMSCMNSLIMIILQS